MKKKLCRTVVAVVLAFTLTACGQTAAHIDWIDFAQFGGIQYIATDFGGSGAGRALTDGDLGPEFAKVQFKLDGNVSDPSYRAKDGDAAFLDAGTPVYSVKGYKPEFRLAARREGRLVLYEADNNPKAKTGADLLDIGGKVRSIGVNSAQDGVTELAAITDPKQVAALVELVLGAPVDQNRRDQGGTWYFIAFHLEDDTIVTRGYWLDSGELSRGIMLPKEFRTAVEQAFAATTPPTTSALHETAVPTALPGTAMPAASPPPILYIDQGGLFEQVAGEPPQRLADVPDKCVLCGSSTGAILATTRTNDAILVLVEQGLRRIRLADGTSDLVLRFDVPARFGQLVATVDGAYVIYAAVVDDPSAEFSSSTHVGLYQTSSDTAREILFVTKTVQPLGLTADGSGLYLLPRGQDPTFGVVLVAALKEVTITAELPIQGYGGAFLSPDSRYIITNDGLFDSADRPSDENFLSLYDLTAQPLTPRVIRPPHSPKYGGELLWAPNSRAVHLLINTSEDAEGTAYELWRLDVESGEMAQQATVVPPELIGHLAVLHPMTISPDGEWLLLRPETENKAILVHAPTGVSTVFAPPITAVVVGWR